MEVALALLVGPGHCHNCMVSVSTWFMVVLGIAVCSRLCCTLQETQLSRRSWLMNWWMVISEHRQQCIKPSWGCTQQINNAIYVLAKPTHHPAHQWFCCFVWRAPVRDDASYVVFSTSLIAAMQQPFDKAHQQNCRPVFHGSEVLVSSASGRKDSAGFILLHGLGHFPAGSCCCCP